MEWHELRSIKMTNQTAIVYHGTISLFDNINVSMGKPYKDFGKGFYVTRTYSHAASLAERNKRLELERFRRRCEAYVYTYEMDLEMLSHFKVKEFTEADMEWMQFILDNRRTRERAHEYDIVIGPTADDDTSTVLKAYFGGFYGDVGSDDAVLIALKMIEAEKLPPQVYFAQNETTEILKQKGSVIRI